MKKNFDNKASKIFSFLNTGKKLMTQKNIFKRFVIRSHPASLK